MEKVIIAGINTYKSRKELYNSVEELSRLINTAGGETTDTFIQKNKSSPDSYCFIGKGKAEQIAELTKSNGIKAVIFDQNLTPAQQHNLEEIIDAKIIDRTRLILDIFAQRARTKEGALQVELAQLNYYLPRLTKRGVWLDSQVGGIGVRGPGERKLEYDRRRIRDRIAKLKREIENIRCLRKLHRQKRSSHGFPTIALIGYTNVGKSSLLNTVTKKNVVYADNKLFSTLDPTIRKISLPSGRTVLFTDTVGLIRNLPPQLITAFRATLEEIQEAQCLIHLIDSTSDDSKTQEEIVLNTVQQLEVEHPCGADKVPLIRVYNKCDLLTPRQLKRISRSNLCISARTGEGIDKLLIQIDKLFHQRYTQIYRKITIPYKNSNMVNLIHQHSKVISKTYANNAIKMKIQTDYINWYKLQKILKSTSPSPYPLPRGERTKERV